jgi:hypothetical protein
MVVYTSLYHKNIICFLRCGLIFNSNFSDTSKQFDFGSLVPKPLTAAIVITKLKTKYLHYIDYKEAHILT